MKSGENLIEKYPPTPNSIGKKRSLESQKGIQRHIVIKDEISRHQSNAPHKLIVFQKVYLEEEERYEFRFGYYMIGVKGRTTGKWVWGQYCLFVPEQDLVEILNEAKKNGSNKWVQPTRP
ncbi:MAG: hypothetical protein WCQ90_01475 [Deltaproteobacteria bacterium]